MKKTIILTVLILLAVLAISVVSAKTLVAGVVYDMTKEPIETVSGAEVYVACNNSGSIGIKNTTSKSDGTYAVIYYEKSSTPPYCDAGDFVVVNASKGGLYGEANGTVWDKATFDITVDLAVVNVPLIPEFGLVVGLVTVLSAVTIFFIIRRK